MKTRLEIFNELCDYVRSSNAQSPSEPKITETDEYISYCLLINDFNRDDLAVLKPYIKENGYKLVYEPNAKVHVKAPTNVHDFLAQKARVRAGFLLMPSGGPRTIGREVLWFPRELLRVPVSKWPKFIISGFVYLWSWGRGWWYAKTNKSLNQIWQTPISTK